jgi:hypothetical protein
LGQIKKSFAVLAKIPISFQFLHNLSKKKVVKTKIKTKSKKYWEDNESVAM